MTDGPGRAQNRARVADLALTLTARSFPTVLGPLVDTRLTIKQLQVLTTIAGAGSTSTSALAAHFEVSKATMSRLVGKLVDRGLVQRAADAHDQRVRPLALTALGREVAHELLATRPELDDAVLDRLSDSELAALATALTAVDRELRALSPEGDS